MAVKGCLGEALDLVRICIIVNLLRYRHTLGIVTVSQHALET